MTFEPLTVVERCGVVESVHYGAYVVIDAGGAVVAARGDHDVRVFGRSAWKPVQAAAMVACGLAVPDELLAVAASSHSGSAAHLDVVRALLERAGKPQQALANTPDLPFDRGHADAVLAAGGHADALTANCSGKHAAMITTCSVNGWAVNDGAYLAIDHPLQRAILRAVQDLGGSSVRPGGFDGCAAPTFTSTLRALADAFQRLVTSAEDSPEGAVVRAMTTHPVLSAGDGRVASGLMQALPGTLAKDGAEGVFAAADPSWGAMAIKVADGSPRTWRPLIAEILAGLGVDVSRFEHAGVLSADAHGEPLTVARVI